MPTRAGWLVALLGVSLGVGGRLLGLVELYVLGALAGGLVVLAVIRLRSRPLGLAVARLVEPERVPCGAEARVELRLTNRSRRPSPALALHDAVSGTQGARLLVAPIAPGEATAAAYRLPTNRRGIVSIGPLTVEVIEPLGLARRRRSAAPAAELIVHPIVHPLTALPEPDGTDPHAGSDVSAPVSISGNEFHTLRAYVSGDDIRRIHWPSTARHDQLLVRQDERPRQGLVTVLLDTRAPACTEQSLDITASVAASVLDSAQRRRELTRLITTGGIDSGFSAGTVHADTILRALAVLTPTRPGTLLAAIETALSRSTRSALVIVSAGFAPSDIGAIALGRRRAGTCTVVVVDPSAWEPSLAESTSHPVAANVLVSHRNPFPRAWELARHQRGRSRSHTVGAAP